MGVHADAVVRDRAVDIRARRGEVRELAAQAVPDTADPAGLVVARPQCVDRGGDVVDALVDVARLEQGEGPLPLLGRVAELDPRLDAPEQVRGEHDIPLFGEPVSSAPDELVDAEDLLDHHHARAGPGRRLGQVGRERTAVAAP